MVPVHGGEGEKQLEQHCMKDLLSTLSSKIQGRAECGGVDIYTSVLDPEKHPMLVVEPNLGSP